MVDRKKGFKIWANLILMLLSLFCLLPFILLIVSSMTDEKALLTNGYSFFTTQVSFAAYRYLLVDSESILRGYIISIFVTVVGTTLSLLITTLFSYPLSRRDLPGRRFFSFVLFFTMLFNGGLVPSYIMWTQTFQIKNTVFALLIPNLLMSAFYVIMMRTYLTTNIPDAVIEAAKIDGAGEFRVLASVALPMSVPIMATLSLLIGLNYWNDWLNGLYYISTDKLYSIQVLLNKMLLDSLFTMSGMNTKLNVDLVGTMPTTGIKMAVAVLGALPILVVYPFFQKYFIKGIVIGAVKG